MRSAVYFYLLNTVIPHHYYLPDPFNDTMLSLPHTYYAAV